MSLLSIDQLTSVIDSLCCLISEKYDIEHSALYSFIMDKMNVEQVEQVESKLHTVLVRISGTDPSKEMHMTVYDKPIKQVILDTMDRLIDECKYDDCCYYKQVKEMWNKINVNDYKQVCDIRKFIVSKCNEKKENFKNCTSEMLVIIDTHTSYDFHYYIYTDVKLNEEFDIFEH